MVDPPHYYLVTIEFDAANSYDALLRDTHLFRFKLNESDAATLVPQNTDADLTSDANAMIDAALDKMPPPDRIVRSSPRRRHFRLICPCERSWRRFTPSAFR